jgi:hypothetical protein
MEYRERLVEDRKQDTEAAMTGGASDGATSMRQLLITFGRRVAILVALAGLVVLIALLIVYIKPVQVAVLVVLIPLVFLLLLLFLIFTLRPDHVRITAQILKIVELTIDPSKRPKEKISDHQDNQ